MLPTIVFRKRSDRMALWQIFTTRSLYHRNLLRCPIDEALSAVGQLNLSNNNRPESAWLSGRLLLVKENLRLIRETLIKSARAVSERFFLRQKNGKQRNTVCISCFSFCMDGEKDPLFSRRRDGEKDPLFSRRRFIQRFLSSGSYILRRSGRQLLRRLRR